MRTLTKKKRDGCVVRTDALGSRLVAEAWTWILRSLFPTSLVSGGRKNIKKLHTNNSLLWRRKRENHNNNKLCLIIIKFLRIKF